MMQAVGQSQRRRPKRAFFIFPALLPKVADEFQAKPREWKASS